jgi:hypothetical protein
MEDSGKPGLVSKTRLLCDIHQGQVRLGQQFFRPIDAPLYEPLVEGEMRDDLR